MHRSHKLHIQKSLPYRERNVNKIVEGYKEDSFEFVIIFFYEK